MTKKKYVVRVVLTKDEHQTHVDDVEQGAQMKLLECLRYAGLVRVHEVDLKGLTVYCFDMICPHGLESDVWANMNARRMQTFGFNAVKAPSTI